MLKTFRVTLPEARIVTYEVKANDVEDAIDLVANGEGMIVENEVDESQDWDTNEWEVSEIS